MKLSEIYYLIIENEFAEIGRIWWSYI